MYNLINLHRRFIVRESMEAIYVNRYGWLVEHRNEIATTQYQTVYRSFWKMRFPSEGYCDHYFRILDACVTNPVEVPTIETLIDDLAPFGGLEFSFVTKLLHTLNNRIPVYDSRIAAFYLFRPPVAQSPRRMNALLEFYSFLCSEYARVLRLGLLKPSIALFRATFPAALITDEKIIDFLLWTFCRSNAVVTGVIQYS